MKLLVSNLLDTTTNVSNDKDNSIQSPQKFSIEQNYPNPFNASTKITYRLATDVDINLSVYNITGTLVALLALGMKNTGSYTVDWDGTDSIGNVLPSGVYIYRLEAGEFKSMKKMFLIK